MEKKRVVPVWVSVVLMLMLLAGIVLNVLYTYTTYNTIAAIHTRVFDLIACILALAYCFKGYRKNAAVFFNSFSIIYCISCMFPIFCIAESYQAGFGTTFAMLLHLLIFACLSIFALSRDIGKKKSIILAGVVLACTLINVALAYMTTTSASFLLGMSGKVILAVVFFIMVYAKYQDKASRGTK